MNVSRRFSLFFILIGFWSCHKNETIKLEGLIEGCPATDIFLYSGQTRLDSSSVRNGHFEFSELPVPSKRMQLYIRNDHFWSPITIYPEQGITKLEIDFEKSTPLVPVFNVSNNSNHVIFDNYIDSIRTNLNVTYGQETEIKVDMALRLLRQNKNRAINEDICLMLAQFLDPLHTGESAFNKLKRYCQMENDSNSLYIIDEKMRMREKLNQQKTIK
ncbi:MAG: DUF4369 domain-containing protein [Prolixibacteraceae bacterium]